MNEENVTINERVVISLTMLMLLNIDYYRIRPIDNLQQITKKTLQIDTLLSFNSISNYIETMPLPMVYCVLFLLINEFFLFFSSVMTSMESIKRHHTKTLYKVGLFSIVNKLSPYSFMTIFIYAVNVYFNDNDNQVFILNYLYPYIHNLLFITHRAFVAHIISIDNVNLALVV